MIIDVKLLNAVGLERTHDTRKDTLLYHLALVNPENLKKVDAVLNEMFYPFYRFFSNYGTGIGETLEEVVGRKFTDFLSKEETKVGKKGQPLKSTAKSKVYSDYNKTHNKKPSNYDWLANIKNEIKSVEVKVIRAAESKPNQDNKIYEIPALLEERALSFSEGVGGNGSFQQTKAEMFDYMLGVVMYSDQVDFYIIPSADIKSGKLKVTNQHANATKTENGMTSEGHLAVKYLDSYKVLSVYSEEELLAKDMLNKYIT